MSKEDQWFAVMGMERDIERAARHLTMEWPEVVDSWEDMAMDIRTRLVAGNQAIKVSALESKPRRKTLHKIGQQIASALRDDYEHFSGNFLYSTDDIRRILAGGILLQDEKTIRNVQYRDVLTTYYQLNSDQQTILRRKFIDGDQLDNKQRMLLTRAVDKLTLTLNRKRRKESSEHNGPGSRKAITNARAITSVGNHPSDLIAPV